MSRTNTEAEFGEGIPREFTEVGIFENVNIRGEQSARHMQRIGLVKLSAILINLLSEIL